MNDSVTSNMMRALPAEHRQRLLHLAHEVSFEVGSRLFEEGGRADRFWIVRTGTIALDMRVPGRRANVSLYEVPDADALHVALTSLPLFPWLDIRVEPLATHPLGTPDVTMTQDIP
jgi:muconolactone delta-isomerase